MNEHLRDRINRKLETLSDERLYQVLDYVEFLEAKYAEKPAAATDVFRKFAETVEDKLRAGRVSANTISETMGLMNRAMGVLSGVAATGRSVANDLYNAVATPGAPGTTPGGSSGGTTPGSTPSTTTPTPPTTPPATGGERP